MRLTDTAVRNARPGDRPKKLFDGDDLYLFVSTAGHRAWRFKYHIDGKEKHLHFGRYPEISLKAARERRLEARRALETDEDPGVILQAERAARSASFESLAMEWLGMQRKKLTLKTYENKRDREGYPSILRARHSHKDIWQCETQVVPARDSELQD